MPILGDLSGAAPIDGYASRKVSGKRTLGDPGTYPTGLASGGGNGTSFAAARIDRLTQDFIGRLTSADTEIFGSNQRMRARMRSLALNDPYIRKWLAMVEQNVVGPAGILMQAKVRSVNGAETAQTKRINERIEEEWIRWGQRGNCTADGKFSWLAVQRMAIRLAASEGESLTKFAYGRQFNTSAITLQMLDNDQLDDTMMMGGDNGNQIRMGVEVDQYLKPVAYHLFSGHPYDMFGQRNRERKRVPAEFVTHAAVWERPGQTRGFTWASAVVQALNHLGAYEQAVLVASRFAASKVFSIEKTQAEGLYTGGEDDDDDTADLQGSDKQMSVSGDTGEGIVLADGEHLNFIDPRFPTANHKQFMETMVRTIASGLLVDFPTLANNLEGVNFSSIRAGMLDTRDSYRVIQRWLIESFCQPIFQGWLRMALTTSLADITLTPAQMSMFHWRPRGWEWVDPVKDADAAILRLSNGLSTYARELGSVGLDFEETMQERAKEQAYIAKLGLVLGTDLAGDQGGKGVAAGDETEAAQVDGAGAGKGGK